MFGIPQAMCQQVFTNLRLRFEECVLVDGTHLSDIIFENWNFHVFTLLEIKIIFPKPCSFLSMIFKNSHYLMAQPLVVSVLIFHFILTKQTPCISWLTSDVILIETFYYYNKIKMFTNFEKFSKSKKFEKNRSFFRKAVIYQKKNVFFTFS